MDNFLGKRDLLLRSIKVEIRAQHAGTVLGMAWIILGPLLLLSLYALIYAVVFDVRLPNFSRSEYILNVFSGLVLFIAFSQAMSASTTALSKEQKLIFSNFPPEFIPTKSVAVAYLVLLPATVFVVLGDVVFSQASWHLLLLPVVALLQLAFSIGLGCLLSLLGLVMRDISFLIQYIVTAILIVTPIAYTPDMVPAKIKPLLYLNPLYYYVSANQHLILLNRLPPMIEIVLGTVMSIGMFLLGVWVFKRARMAMMDLL
ncbi:ABC transporter permease [uncultured Rhodoferax sp.]|uniref:ABC transporter permease n=1 Tax=uncultured Rhodoferax sp. TaxID=223188 RepID=UPI0025E98B36|nr:ABC transporter permease [uncultured Rhodoferax sp.]